MSVQCFLFASALLIHSNFRNTLGLAIISTITLSSQAIYLSSLTYSLLRLYTNPHIYFSFMSTIRPDITASVPPICLLIFPIRLYPALWPVGWLLYSFICSQLILLRLYTHTFICSTCISDIRERITFTLPIRWHALFSVFINVSSFYTNLIGSGLDLFSIYYLMELTVITRRLAPTATYLRF